VDLRDEAGHRILPGKESDAVSEVAFLCCEFVVAEVFPQPFDEAVGPRNIQRVPAVVPPLHGLLDELQGILQHSAALHGAEKGRVEAVAVRVLTAHELVLRAQQLGQRPHRERAGVHIAAPVAVERRVPKHVGLIGGRQQRVVYFQVPFAHRFHESPSVGAAVQAVFEMGVHFDVVYHCFVHLLRHLQALYCLYEDVGNFKAGRKRGNGGYATWKLSELMLALLEKDAVLFIHFEDTFVVRGVVYKQ
jgi:hypothetical protein